MWIGHVFCSAIFDHFDRNGDGKLNFSELGELNKAAGMDLTESAYRWVINTFESDGAGRVTKVGAWFGILLCFVEFSSLCRLYGYVFGQLYSGAKFDVRRHRALKE